MHCCSKLATPLMPRPLLVPCCPASAQTADPTCVQVLHHISSVSRRVALLQQMASLLAPGGKGLVTAWAILQDEPGKLAKWESIPSAERLGASTLGGLHGPDSSCCTEQQAASLTAAEGQLERSTAEQLQGAAGADFRGQPSCGEVIASSSASAAAEPAAASGVSSHSESAQKHHPHVRGSSGRLSASQEGICRPGAEGEQAAESCRPRQPAAEQDSNDYFVPWHLPLHRAEAAAALAAAGQAGGASSGVLDHGKGTVVFKRYYHLFEAGELEGLLQQVQGVVLLDSFWDKGNWCCLFCRQQ